MDSIIFRLASSTGMGQYEPYHQLTLEKGSYVATPIKGDDDDFTAWNAWSGVADECTSPTECKRGWLTSFNAWCQDFRSAPNNTIKNRSFRSEDIATAIAHANSLPFRLTRRSFVNFFIADTLDDDNIGGLTIRLEKIG